MKFSIQHQRSLLGDDLVVGMEAEEEERISRVTITLDGFDLSDDAIDPPVFRTNASSCRQAMQACTCSISSLCWREIPTAKPSRRTVLARCDLTVRTLSWHRCPDTVVGQTARRFF